MSNLTGCAPVKLIYQFPSFPLLGTNVQEAQNILKSSGLPITSAVDLEDAAKKAVASVAKK